METKEHAELKKTNKTSKVSDNISAALSARHTTEAKNMNKPDPDQDAVQYAGTS